jgi:hypothetical protein
VHPVIGQNKALTFEPGSMLTDPTKDEAGSLASEIGIDDSEEAYCVLPEDAGE